MLCVECDYVRNMCIYYCVCVNRDYALDTLFEAAGDGVHIYIYVQQITRGIFRESTNKLLFKCALRDCIQCSIYGIHVRFFVGGGLVMHHILYIMWRGVRF